MAMTKLRLVSQKLRNEPFFAGHGLFTLSLYFYETLKLVARVVIFTQELANLTLIIIYVQRLDLSATSSLKAIESV